MDNKLKKTMIISVVIIFAIFFVVIIIGLMNNRTLSYFKIEQKLKDAAVEYYNAYPKKLPAEEDNESKVDSKTLIDKEYIKSLSKYTDGKECSGEVYVTLRDGEYLYTPYLNCEDYNTKTLSNNIIENESIIEDKNAGEAGLYKYDSTLIYRGENVNNYVSFAGQMWQILRIDENHNIRMIQTESVGKFIWDNRYNIYTGENSGYNDFEKSRMKESFVSLYNGDYGEIFTENEKKFLVKDYLCLDSKNENSFNQNGVIYCNVKSKDKYPFTLPDISEYFIASVDQNCNSFNNYSCMNYNYMDNYSSYWSMNIYEGNTYQAYYISGGAELENINNDLDLRLVVTLSKHALYNDGDGSYDNPYTIQE